VLDDELRMSMPLHADHCRAGFTLASAPRSARLSSAGRLSQQFRCLEPSVAVATGSRRIPTFLWRAADRVALTLVFGLTLTLAERGGLPTAEAVFGADLELRSWLGLLLFLLYWEALATWLGLYDARWLERGGYTWRRALVCLLGSLPMAALPVDQGTHSLGFGGALMFGATATLAISGIQVAGQLLRCLAHPRKLRQVVIVGSGARALEAYCYLSSSEGGFHEVLGFLDDQVQPSLGRTAVPYLGTLDRLDSVLERHVVDEVQIALPVRSCYAQFQQVITRCERAGVECSYQLDTFVHRSRRRILESSAERPAIRVRPLPSDDPLLLKRMFDIVVAAAMLFLLSPLMALIALAVKLTSPGPVLFAQNRYGKNKRLFRMYKFRSMRADAELVLRRDRQLFAEYCQGNFKLPEKRDPRLTPLGRLLRKTSMDELPQLWNVLRGEMAIVGPRPIVPAELVHYGPGAHLLLALKPGLTSAWVLSGRSAVGYPKRAELELGYVRNWSLRRDTWILLKTVPFVLTGRGAH
jgi:exopolysaccharide biosynthesis polyprenyl glycosylphosphotransferase